MASGESLPLNVRPDYPVAMDELAFVFAAGEGKYDAQGIYLARSIARTNPDAQMYAYVPDGEEPAHEPELAELGTILRGPPTIPEYGISRKIDALQRAQAAADAPYCLLLDTDTLVFDRITIHESGEQLYLKPVDVGRQYWGRESQSGDRWRELAAEAGLPTPEWQHRSTFDDRPIPPYWNAGCVLTGADDFADRWLSLTEELYPEIPYQWHADQVALGLLSQEYTVGQLDNRYNYPMHLRLRCRPDVAILHYHNLPNLNKCPDHESFFRAIGAWEAIRETNYSWPHGVWRYLKRKRLPLNERHRLERLYDAVTGRLP